MSSIARLGLCPRRPQPQVSADPDGGCIPTSVTGLARPLWRPGLARPGAVLACTPTRSRQTVGSAPLNEVSPDRGQRPTHTSEVSPDRGQRPTHTNEVSPDRGQCPTHTNEVSPDRGQGLTHTNEVSPDRGQHPVRSFQTVGNAPLASIRSRWTVGSALVSPANGVSPDRSHLF